MIELGGMLLVVSLWEWSWLCDEMKIQEPSISWSSKVAWNRTSERRKYLELRKE